MTRPSDITPEIYEWAEIFCDEHRETDDRELVARAFMAGQAASPEHDKPISLTPRQADCLKAIYAHQAAHHVSPTVRDLMAVLGLASTSGVCRLLEGLERRGCIKRLQGRARAISILKVSDVSAAHNISVEA